MEIMSTPGLATDEIRIETDRAEVFCDRFDTQDAINEALQGIDTKKLLVILVLSTTASAQSIAAVAEAITCLKNDNVTARVLINLPAQTDGTDIFRTPPTHLHNALQISKTMTESRVVWMITLCNESIWQLDGVFGTARDNGITVLTRPGLEPMSEEAQLFAWDFVTYNLLSEARHLYGPESIRYFEKLQSRLYRNEFSQGYTRSGTFESGLTAALQETAVTASQSSAITFADLTEMASHLIRAHLKSFAIKKKKNIPESFEKALLVGAYGGEHIGDIAILGGVLLRMHKEFGLTKAVLLTQRLNHTRHLIPMLRTPVEISVQEYTLNNINKNMAQCDALVHAGGPLTDIPKQLVRHLYAAALAGKAGKPYFIEGIGPTTFKRTASRITARKMLSLADRIVVRTKQDASAVIINGLNISTGRDPAFDYLETLGENLTDSLSEEGKDIESLLTNTGGRPVIGINIRPINDLFTPSKNSGDRLSFTRSVEDKMETELAKGIAQFAVRSSARPVFIFFPMNAIQFGKSDNRSAYRIARHLPADIDARFWQRDASLNSVVTLIRRCDTVISMRFHATIFALSQNCMPIGIDYRIGTKYKVTAVMEDAQQAEFCCRIDEVDSNWIADRLAARLSTVEPGHS